MKKEKITTAKQALDMVKEDGHSLLYVPENLITMEVCLVAVQDGGFNLEYVPDKLRTEELCFEAAKSVIRLIEEGEYDEGDDEDFLELVPKELRSKVEKIFLDDSEGEDDLP